MGVVSMVNVTVSGHPGSGTSTLVRGLVERFGWSSLNGGDVFREEAKRRGMTLGEFGELCKNELEVEAALEANRLRAAVDGERFSLLYDLTPEDPEPYTHVLDATSLNATQILDHVVGLLEEAA